MATVPGVPDNTIPKTFAPTQADMLMAAAIMHQQGRFQQPSAFEEEEAKAAKKMPLDIRLGKRVPGGVDWSEGNVPELSPRVPRMEELNK